MKELSSKRKRTLALQERAIKFSVNVNRCCPEHFSNMPSKTVWGQLVRAADITSNNLLTGIGGRGHPTDGDLLDDHPQYAVAARGRKGKAQRRYATAYGQDVKLNWNSKLNCQPANWQTANCQFI